MGGSRIGIGVVGFLVWGHHMFVSGESPYTALTFSFLSYIVAIPSAVKIFNWTSTLYKGSISWDTPMVYALGFIGLFLIRGLPGLFLPRPRPDLHIPHNSFLVAPLHYIIVCGARLGYVAGPNPWPATGLEWKTDSPPPTENFHVTPEVTWEPYDYRNRHDLGLGAEAQPLAPAHGDD